MAVKEIKDRVSKVEFDLTNIVNVVETHTSSIVDAKAELKDLRKAKHDHNDRIHATNGILCGMESLVKGLVEFKSVSEESTKANTLELRDFKTAFKTFTVMMKLFLSFCTGVAAVVVFIGGKIMHWW